MRYSVVIPVYDEARSIRELVAELLPVMESLGRKFEVIFVDDGSTDRSFDILSSLCDKDSRIRAIRFSRNFGKSSAYMAGFEHARAPIVITMDADLQDDPSEIPNLVKKLDEGYELVIGWKQGRAQNELRKTVPSRVYNKLKAWMFGLNLHDSNSGFRVMRHELAKTLVLYGDRYRFIPELAHLRGFRVAEVPVNHRRRRHGRSKYGPARFWTGLLDMLSVRFLSFFGRKPLHFFGTVALVPIVVGTLLEIYVLGQKLSGSTFQQHVGAMIIGVMMILIGVQLLGIGLVGEMVSAQSRTVGYFVRQRIGFGDVEDESG